jgi:hypothetical protein
MYDAHRFTRPDAIGPKECRTMRERQNWTRSQLAKASTVPLWYIDALESGEAIPLILASFQSDLRRALEINTLL